MKYLAILLILASSGFALASEGFIVGTILDAEGTPKYDVWIDNDEENLNNSKVSSILVGSKPLVEIEVSIEDSKKLGCAITPDQWNQFLGGLNKGLTNVQQGQVKVTWAVKDNPEATTDQVKCGLRAIVPQD